MLRWRALTLLVVLTTTACGRTTPVAVNTPVLSAAPSPLPSLAPVPVAAPSPRGDSFLVANGLYTAGKMRAVKCTLPVLVAANAAAILGYARTLVDCLNRAWGSLVPHADVIFLPAQLVTFGAGVCNPEEDVTGRGAFYDLHSTICLDWHTYGAVPQAGWRTVQLQHTVAHEYGHHLQMLTGIIASYQIGTLRVASGDLERNRRMELQASCFAAVFIGAHKSALSVTGSRLRQFEAFVSLAGDENAPKLPPDHGSRKSHAYWSFQGFRSKDPGSCNTFTAPAQRVA